MTSPRQRKKRLALFKLKEKLKKETVVVVEHKPVVVEKQVEEKKSEPAKLVASPPPVVVESAVEPKQKKAKAGLVEMKPQEQVVEQPKQEVKTETKE